MLSAMAPRIINGSAEIKALVGEHLGYSDWLVVTQEKVNQFADATGDHQWIHVDPERARRESPFGAPVAHGFLTLSLLPALEAGWLGGPVTITALSGVSGAGRAPSLRTSFTELDGGAGFYKVGEVHQHVPEMARNFGRLCGGEVPVAFAPQLAPMSRGILLTAIIVAGRSGSAFAAEIGAMNLNEEIDALRATGVQPVEVLVLPRCLGLVIALPLLTVIADAVGILGGALLCHVLLDMPLVQYFQRVDESIGDWTFWVGIIKAPVFAGDTIHVEVEVIEARLSKNRPGRGLVRTRNHVVKQDGTVACIYTPLRMIKCRNAP